MEEKKMCAIVVGDISRGFTFVGPFPMVGEAIAYIDEYLYNEEYFIVDLEPPENDNQIMYLVDFIRLHKYAVSTIKYKPDSDISVRGLEEFMIAKGWTFVDAWEAK